MSVLGFGSCTLLPTARWTSRPHGDHHSLCHSLRTRWSSPALVGRPRSGGSWLAPRRSKVVMLSEMDPYEVLGVPRDATDVLIKKAYRRAALRSHPDVNKSADAQERFMQIQAAYAILSDGNKRAAYDRQKATAGFGGGFDDFAAGAARARASGFGNAAEYARRWRERNPMPEDLNDSFGSIFGDIFAGVSSVVGGGPGIFEDFVEFLEDQAGGFAATGAGQQSGYDSDGSSADEGLDEILETGSVEVLHSELEDTTFLLAQLRAREAKLRKEADKLQERADQWAARAKRPEAQLDYDSRQASADRQKELNDEAKRLRIRRKKVARHISAQEKRELRIRSALADRQRNKGAEEAPPSQNQTNPRTRDVEAQRRQVDEELEKLKREMGL